MHNLIAGVFVLWLVVVIAMHVVVALASLLAWRWGVFAILASLLAFFFVARRLQTATSISAYVEVTEPAYDPTYNCRKARSLRFARKASGRRARH